ncbi:hypothetical protein FQA47_000744 [Oryzias melastigma]|uniref:Uncharacterized protein n=1 Tax=Oryzias melastigma TaxID=30732 RepID=A0A834CRP1_ORYME|nr:hypothetical protein FQA47_000744 [Oryzias melastigma]
MEGEDPMAPQISPTIRDTKTFPLFKFGPLGCAVLFVLPIWPIPKKKKQKKTTSGHFFSHNINPCKKKKKILLLSLTVPVLPHLITLFLYVNFLDIKTELPVYFQMQVKKEKKDVL